MCLDERPSKVIVVWGMRDEREGGGEDVPMEQRPEASNKNRTQKKGEQKKGIIDRKLPIILGKPVVL